MFQQSEPDKHGGSQHTGVRLDGLVDGLVLHGLVEVVALVSEDKVRKQLEGINQVHRDPLGHLMSISSQ